MRSERVNPGIVHAANSPATILVPDSHFDMVRCGIAIYGLHPSKGTYSAVDLAPAMTVKTRISLVKRIGMGEGVSYGLTWRAATQATIATLPIGYADGVHRLLSNRMSVLLRGRRVSQVGRVCMDQLMIEVPRDVEVAAGDECVLVGAQRDQRISMDRSPNSRKPSTGRRHARTACEWAVCTSDAPAVRKHRFSRLSAGGTTAHRR
jgi:alanine racemase